MRVLSKALRKYAAVMAPDTSRPPPPPAQPEAAPAPAQPTQQPAPAPQPEAAPASAQPAQPAPAPVPQPAPAPVPQPAPAPQPEAAPASAQPAPAPVPQPAPAPQPEAAPASAQPTQQSAQQPAQQSAQQSASQPAQQASSSAGAAAGRRPFSLDDEQIPVARAAVNDPKSEAGQQVISTGANNAVQEALAGAQTNDPQTYGAIVSDALNKFYNLDPMSQIAIGLGLSVGTIGLLNATLGEGGVGSFLTGALGLGAAGLAGSAGGLFGQGAANAVGDAAYNAGTFFGAMPEKADFSLLRGAGAVDRIGAGGDDPSRNTREYVKTQLDALPKHVESLTKLMQAPLPEPAKLQMMRRLDSNITSIDDARQILQNGQEFLTQYNNPESALQQRLNRAKTYSEMQGLPGAVAERYFRGVPGVMSDVRQSVGNAAQTIGDTVSSGKKWLSENAENAGVWLSRMMLNNNANAAYQEKANAAIQKWAFNDMDAKELHDIREEKARGVPYRTETARREHKLNLRKMMAQKPTTSPAKKCVAVVMKAARCWAGYEPVPGAKAYSRGSCRPVGTKKTQKEMKSGKKSKK